jgi:hypothetical protein
VAEYTYFGIVNEILHSINEVPFTTESEFNDASGSYLHVKESVNDVISDIYEEGENRWGFQWTETSSVLPIGDNTLTSPTDSANIDWKSFHIDRVYGNEDSLVSLTADSDTKTFTFGASEVENLGFATGMAIKFTGIAANSDTDLTIVSTTSNTIVVSEAISDVSMTTSFIVKNASIYDRSKHLNNIDINHYRRVYLNRARDAKVLSDYRVPDFVVETNDNNIIIGPTKPNATYLLRYGYYSEFMELSDKDDVPAIPNRFKYVIKAGVLGPVNEFRDNPEMAAYHYRKYQDGIDKMKDELIPNPTSLRYLM